MESNFEKDLIESEALFKQQFNPDSIHFHNGDPTPVPLGGQRIPNSMPTVYNQDPAETVEKKIDYGKEYDHLFNIREILNTLKKALAKLTPLLEAILRHKETFNKSGNPSNPAHVAKLQKSIDGEKEKIALVLKELKDLLGILKQFPEYQDSYYVGLNKIIENATIDYKDKEHYAGYSFEVKNYSKDLFKEMGILLEKMKAIKKEAEGKNINKKGVLEQKEKKEENGKCVKKEEEKKEDNI